MLYNQNERGAETIVVSISKSNHLLDFMVILTAEYIHDINEGKNYC